MVVCEMCLQAIESREGNQITKKFDSTNGETKYGYIDDEGNFVEDEYSDDEFVFCEWCDRYELVEECYVIYFREEW